MRIVACGQTIAHRPQSMQMSGSQIGISWAIERFSYLAVPVGNVPSTGSAETGSRSPSPAISSAVTRLTKSGASSGMACSTPGGGRHRRRDVDAVQGGERRVDRREVALDDRPTPRCRRSFSTDALMWPIASSAGSTPARAKKHGCMTVLMRLPICASRATR